MFLDQVKLHWVESTRFAQNLGRNADLADVVQVAGHAQSFLPARVEAELSADGNRNLADPPRVAGSVGVAHFAQVDCHLDGAHERGFELCQVTLSLLLGALFLRDVLHHPDHRRAVVVGGG